MKKTVLIVAAIFITSGALLAQDKTGESGKNTHEISLKHRPADHFMLQLSYDGWTAMPDSISSHKKGFSRGFNMYFMFDKVFKSSPKLSLGIGAGISTSNVYFDKLDVRINGQSKTVPFVDVSSANHFRKYKVATSFLELPIELRYTSKPENFNKSLKAAVGIKLGTMVNAHTKGKELLDANNSKIQPLYSEKINSKIFMNTTRFMATARVGYGIVSVFGSYGLSNVFKEGTAAEMKPYQIGITISGL